MPMKVDRLSMSESLEARVPLPGCAAVLDEIGAHRFLAGLESTRRDLTSCVWKLLALSL
jgi:hypothetical protein